MFTLFFKSFVIPPIESIEYIKKLAKIKEIIKYRNNKGYKDFTVG